MLILALITFIPLIVETGFKAKVSGSSNSISAVHPQPGDMIC